MAILGIGLDVVSLERLGRIHARHGAAFRRRICRPGEVKPYQGQALIEHLGGLFVTAADMHIGDAELLTVRRETRWVTGIGGVPGGSGNPSPFTALGCLEGYRAVLEELFGDPSFEGRHFLLQGLGQPYFGTLFPRLGRGNGRLDSA